MKSKWYVQYNPMGGYIATRTKNVNEVVHSGNLEHYGEYCDDEATVQAIVDKLNEEDNN